MQTKTPRDSPSCRPLGWQNLGLSETPSRALPTRPHLLPHPSLPSGRLWLPLQHLLPGKLDFVGVERVETLLGLSSKGSQQKNRCQE